MAASCAIVTMALGGICAEVNGVRRRKVFTGNERRERSDRDRPVPLGALDHRDASGVLAVFTPGERRRLVLLALGGEPTGVARGAVDIAPMASRRAVGRRLRALPFLGQARRDGETALRAGGRAVRDLVFALGALDEHAQL